MGRDDRDGGDIGIFLPNRKQKVSFCDQVDLFYRNKVLKLVFANIKKRTKKTNDIFTTKLFSAKKWIFQQDGARPHQVN